MANEVYANGNEIACKSADGKSIASFPDVCFTPPQTPATPPGVPIPYPNTGMASDCTEGSKTVQISGQEIMLKDKSYFKKSTGDEAGSAPKKGVVSSQITGKVYFTMWSMDVKFEGENVVRHLDMTTHNHGSAGNTGPWVYADRTAMAKDSNACGDELKEVDANCKRDEEGNVSCPKKESGMSHEDYAKKVESDPCQRAARCLLSKKTPSSCCPPQTPHHLVPKAGFFKDKYGGTPKENWTPGYDQAAAPCICAEGYNQAQGTHGLLHDQQAKAIYKAGLDSSSEWKFSAAVSNASAAVEKVFPQCKKGCIEAQLRTEHAKMGITDGSNLRPIPQQPEDIAAFAKEWGQLREALSTVADAAPK